jgi:hypothetical protein
MCTAKPKFSTDISTAVENASLTPEQQQRLLPPESLNVRISRDLAFVFSTTGLKGSTRSLAHSTKKYRLWYFVTAMKNPVNSRVSAALTAAGAVNPRETAEAKIIKILCDKNRKYDLKNDCSAAEFLKP